MLLKTSRNLSRRTTSRGFSSLADSLNSSLAETDPDLLAIINDEKQRQKESDEYWKGFISKYPLFGISNWLFGKKEITSTTKK